jgi:ABC-type sugar transport system ATPase subunit
MVVGELAPSTSGAKLEVEGIWKSFPGVVALADVSLTLRPGEVLGLLGENGAGKSTLIKVLSGLYRSDRGTILLNGNPVEFNSPQEALAGGIATVFQEGMLVPNLSVAANIMLGREPRAGPWGLFVDSHKLALAAQDALKNVGFSVRTDRSASTLTVAERQLAEIARAASMAASVVVLDEPTAALTPDEVDNLFQVIRELRDRGVPILYVTHRLEEVPRICDRAVVLRDGRIAGELKATEIKHEAIVSLMIGRQIQAMFPTRPTAIPPTEVVLTVDGVTIESAPPVTFSVGRGEIVALAGLVGGGQKEVARAIFGALARSGGTVLLNGREIVPSSPEASVRAGMGYLSGERHREGVVPLMSLRKNLSLAALRRLSRFGFVRLRRERAVTSALRERFRIRSSSLDQPMGLLSGGNQQKALLARWAANEPSVLILDDPTLGVDIGSRQEVYELIATITHQGVGVLLVSSDIPEVVGVSDRVLIFAGRRIVAELERTDATEAAVLRYATQLRVNDSTTEDD